MARTKSSKYDYPKKKSLNEISKEMFNISYCETNNSQMNKIKKKFKEINY